MYYADQMDKSLTIQAPSGVRVCVRVCVCARVCARSFWDKLLIIQHGCINSFIHSRYLYSASSSLLLLRGVPDKALILGRSFMPKRHRQLRVKDLPKDPMLGLERDSNTRPFGWKATNLPMSHHTPCGNMQQYSCSAIILSRSLLFKNTSVLQYSTLQAFSPSMRPTLCSSLSFARCLCSFSGSWTWIFNWTCL